MRDSDKSVPIASKGSDTKEHRCHMRFDKMFPVLLDCGDSGETAAIARNISAGGMLVETSEPMPLKTEIVVHFLDSTGANIAARAQVRHHYCFNYEDNIGPAASRGMGLRFVEFLEDCPPKWLQSLTKPRILH